MITSRLSYPPLSLRVLSRIYRNGPFGKSARVSVILLFLLTLLIFPTSTASASVGGLDATNPSCLSGSPTVTNDAPNNRYILNVPFASGCNVPSGLAAQTWELCDGIWYVRSHVYSGPATTGSYVDNLATINSRPGGKEQGDCLGTGQIFQGVGIGLNSTTSSLAAGGATEPTSRVNLATATLWKMAYKPGYSPGPDPAPTGTGNNCTMTDVSLVRLARGAGFPESAIQTAVAVAIAESAGKVNATHFNPPNPGSWDIGLWQINDDAHPTYDRNLLFTSPGYNAVKAYDVYHTATPTIDRFTPWVTYNSGAYNKFMSRAATALQAASTGTLGGNSCNDLSGSDVVEDATDDNTVADDDPNCTMTFNVLKILKCVFIPSAQDTSDYSSKIDTVKTNPPVSVVLAGMTIGRQMLDPSTVCEHDCPANNDATNTTRGYFDSDAQAGIKVQLPDSAAVTYINPIQKAGDWVQNTGGTQPTGAAKVAHFMYILGKFAIIVMFGLYWFRRFTSSLGSKE